MCYTFYMKKMNFYEFPLCKLGIVEEGNDGSEAAICQVFFHTGRVSYDYEIKETPLIRKAAKQLGEYFNGKRKTFDLPLILHGTDFQVAVWKALQNIPYGKTRSYGELAAMTGNPKASRAVGMANNRNPIVIVIPCHRVIGSDGSLTGFGGGLELKQKLLELERK
uniref:Methylated-DNA--protein-cysteine methyltransferase n=1 Tax=uncultured bacterium contig00002 TaxID=1181494 RepID=A0A806KG00_9BACT|nr:methylated-DNA--protein-cysteine methyltransferase [uncultured bacterium contig00002]